MELLLCKLGSSEWSAPRTACSTLGGSDSGYLPDRRLSGPQSQSERRADDKSLSLSEIEHRFSGRPASSQVVILTELSSSTNITKQSKI